MLHILAKNWWLLLLRGMVAILFGLFASAMPELTLVVLMILYGAYALADGIFALATAVGAEEITPKWWLAIVGLFGVAAGLATFYWPGVTALVLILLIGTWTIARGVMEIIGPIKFRNEIDNEWLLILSGLLSVVCGIIVLAQPEAGAFALVWLIAACAIAFGVLMIALSLRLENYRPAAL